MVDKVAVAVVAAKKKRRKKAKVQDLVALKQSRIPARQISQKSKSLAVASFKRSGFPQESPVLLLSIRLCRLVKFICKFHKHISCKVTANGL